LRGAVALACAIPVIILVNATRVLVSGLLQEWFGQAAITGRNHEVLGFAAVFLGLGIVAGITALLRPRTVPATPPAPPVTPTPARRGPELAAGVGLAIGLALTLGVFALPGLVHSADTAENPFGLLASSLDTLTPEGDLERWKAGKDIPISDDLAKQLTFTHGVNRIYKDVVGNEVLVFAFHWTSATAVTGYHHPDICMPGHGLEALIRETEKVRTLGGRPLPVTFRYYEKGRENMSLAYWTQEGRKVWTDADEAAAFSFQYPFLWVRERLTPRPAGDLDDRLVVWCYAQWWASKPGGKDRFLRFVGALADDLYRVCPWADPGPMTDDASKR
jgi:hypothetical protein